MTRPSRATAGVQGGANKYGARVTYVDNIRFASKREAAHYTTLSVRLRLGEIADLELQPLYRFVVNGVTVGRYRPDFRFRDVATGETVVQDVKGAKPRDWYRTKQLMKACHGIDVQEIR